MMEKTEAQRGRKTGPEHTASEWKDSSVSDFRAHNVNKTLGPKDFGPQVQDKSSQERGTLKC